MNKLFLMLTVFFVSIGLSGCGSDDENSPESPIAAIAGTYVGKLNLFPLAGGVDEHYDAEIIVTVVGDGNVKFEAKANKLYSGMTSKVITVAVAGNGLYGNTVQGSVLYTASSKSIQLITNKTSGTDIKVTFQGTKK
ncbi:MAG: hypothetical protein RL662_2041 [Bacteroidota bacterium]